MPHMDGTGPRFACGQNKPSFRGAYAATHRGFGHGNGFGRSADVKSKESLIATKAALQRRLAEVETLLQQS